MINEEKVKLMTHMAVYEKKERNNYAPAESYEKEDYVSLKKVTGFVLSTLMYVFLYGVFVSLLLMFVVTKVNIGILIILIVLGVALFFIHSFYYVKWVADKASRQYDEAAEKIKVVISDYEQLDVINKDKE